MKTNNKKRVFAALTAGFLAITPVMTAGMSAFAAKISVNEVAGDGLTHKYTVYNIITGTPKVVDGETILTDMSWNTDVIDVAKLATALKAAFPTLATNDTVKATMTPDEFATAIAGLDAQKVSKAFLEAGVIKGDGTELTKGSGKYTSEEDFEKGWYLVVDETTTLGDKQVKSANMLRIVNDEDVDITPKLSLPDLTKKIVPTDESQNNLIDAKGENSVAAIGDVITYNITIPVPDVTGYDKYYYVVEDTLSKGLTYNNSLAVSLACNNGKSHKTSLTNNTDYYVVTGDADNDATEIRVIFKDALTQFAGYCVGDTITISYTAILNEDAEIGNTGNPNEAKLVYSNNPNVDWDGDETPGPGTPPGGDDPDDPKDPDEPNEPWDPDKPQPPTGETPEQVVNTYTTAIELDKVDKNGPLAGAKFKLTGTNLVEYIVESGDKFVTAADGAYYKLKDGTYTKTAPTEETAEYYEDVAANADTWALENYPKYKKDGASTTTTKAIETTTTIEAYVDNDGVLRFVGLKPGRYTLQEIEAPEGYNCPDTEYVLIIEADLTATLKPGWKVGSGSNEKFEVEDGEFKIEVLNTKGTSLPETGGLGTKLFYLFGGLMVTGSVVLLVTKKRMSAKES